MKDEHVLAVIDSDTGETYLLTVDDFLRMFGV